jgi:hypothetical protein
MGNTLKTKLNITQKLGLFLVIIGLFIILIYFFYSLFCKACEIHFTIILSVLTAGVILLVGDSILFKYHKDLIDKILDDKKLLQHIETKIEENNELNIQNH